MCLLLVLMFLRNLPDAAPASCQDEESSENQKESSVFREMELSEEALIS